MQTPSMSMNLLGSLGQIQHIWLILLVALPAISLFIGGRLSVALDRTQTRNSSLLQGAFISIPFALLVALLAQINTSSWTNFSAGIGLVVSSQNPTQAIGVSPGAAFLWALITGALFGALGGIYQQSTFKTTLSTKISRLTGPFRLICQPFFFVLDRLTAQSHKQQRSRARTFLYGAVLLSILLLTISIFGGILLILFSPILTAAQNHTIHDILAASLILIPGLAIVSAIAFALSYDQNPEAQLQPEPKNPDPSNQLSSGLEEEHRNHATI
jgi:hypothetical protein